MGHIFISYARQDGRKYAERLDQDLTNAGFATWRDTRNINEYQDFSAEIENAIRAADYVVICITPSIDANPSSFVRREIIYAGSLDKPIIPLVFPNSVIPILVGHLTWIPFSKGQKPNQGLDYENGFGQLLHRLGEKTYPVQVQQPSVDRYRDYLNALYEQVVSYLNQTVFALIALRSEATPEAVEPVMAQVMPMAFWDMAGIDTQKAHRTFRSFHESFTEYKGRILLLGDPGAGKTTTLMAFARDAIVKRLEDPNAPLPIIAPIATWDIKKRFSMAAWLTSIIPAIDFDEISDLLDNGQLLLILDGLDELGGEREIQVEENPPKMARLDPRFEFMRLIPFHNQVVVSCRVKDYNEIHEKIELEGAVTLQPLDDQQLQEYLHDMPQMWSLLKGDEDLRQIARTPLLLSLFTYAFAGLPPEMAENLRELKPGDARDQIIKTFVKRRYEHESRKLRTRSIPETMPFTLDEIYELMGWVSTGFKMVWRYSNLYADAYFKAALFSGSIDVDRIDEFIELSIRLNLLVSSGRSTFRFIHLLIRDHFAYKYALDHLHNVSDYQDAWLSNPAYALGQLGDPRAIDALVDLSKDKDKGIRLSALTALIEFKKDKRAIEALISSLQEDQDYRIRCVAALELGRIGDTSAVEPLIAALEDENYSFRIYAVEALGRLKDKRAVEPLIAFLDSEPEELAHRPIIQALGELEDKRALPILRERRNSNLESVRTVAVAAMKQIETAPIANAILEDIEQATKENEDAGGE